MGPAANVIDREALLERVGGDVEFLQEIARLFLDDCPRMVEQLRSACARGDAQAVQHVAHTLKGCVANFGAQPACDAAFQVERLGRAGDLSGAPEACAALEQELDRFRAALVALSSELAGNESAAA